MEKKFGIDWSKIKEQMNKTEQSGYTRQEDTRFYVPKFKEDGTFEAVIRFLPSVDTDLPYVKFYTHGFKGKNWFIEDCPSTIGRDCPVCSWAREIWNSYDKEKARVIVGRRGRVLSVVSNILVVKDPQTPENEGKVFLYRYGQTIHKKILDAIDPPKDSIDTPVMVHDYYEGANFKLKIYKRKVGDKDQPQYDKCSFTSPSCVGTDEEIEKIRNSQFPIAEFIAPSKYKSYEELSVKFLKVQDESNSDQPRETVPSSQSSSQPSTHSAPVNNSRDEEPKKQEPPKEVDLNFDDDDQGFFAKLRGEA